jgi:putative nucleotidyltransferase with HDIG domain
MKEAEAAVPTIEATSIVPTLGGIEECVHAMSTAWREGRWDDAGDMARAMLAAIGRGEIAETEATKLHNQLGAIAFERGDLKAAETHFGDALAVARRWGAAKGEAAALVNLGAIANVRGQHAQALWHYRCGGWAYHRAGNPAGRARALNNMGMIFADVGRWKSAAGCFEHAEELATSVRDLDLIGLVGVNAAEVYLHLGNSSRARSACDRAYARATVVDDRRRLLEVHRLYGEICRWERNLEDAKRHFAHAIDRARELEVPLVEAESLRSLGHIHLAEGNRREALTCLGRALKLFRGLDAEHELAESLIMRIVEELGREIGQQDGALYSHAARVAQYAGGIALELGLGAEEVKTILVAAYLHDIGKLQIEPAILAKRGALTPAELERVREHTALGADVLKRLDLPWEIATMVRHHHERFDGRGYPDGLSGESIPLGARILLVADVFDALIDERPYRPAWAPEAALQYLRSTAGELGDPVVVDAFLTVAAQLGFGLEAAEPETFVRSIAAYGT